MFLQEICALRLNLEPSESNFLVTNNTALKGVSSIVMAIRFHCSYHYFEAETDK